MNPQEDKVTPIEAAKANVVTLFPYIKFTSHNVIMRTLKKVKGDDVETMTVVCNTPLRAVGRAEVDGAECRVIRFTNPATKKQRTILIPMETIGTSAGWGLLQKHGIAPVSNKTFRGLLAEYLMGGTLYDDQGVPCGLLPEWRVITSSGWDGDIYVLADGTMIAPENADTKSIIVDLNQHKDFTDASVSGTAEDWEKNVGALAKGNTILTLAIGAALAGPMLRICGVRGFGLHFWGGTSKGKTTAMYVASSVNGNPEKRELLWDMTPLALGIMASFHNDSLMGLDEIKQAKGKELARAIYNLFNGKKRVQGDKDGGLRAPINWNAMVMSTGELTVDRHIRLVLGEDIDAGALVRLLNIKYREPEHLHGTANGKAFADLIKRNTHKYYGAFARKWITALVTKPEGAIAQFEKCRERWDGITAQYNQGAFGRVGAQFALIEAALKMAKKYVNQTAQEIEQLMESTFAEWLGDYTSDTGLSHEQSGVVERARDVLAQIGRFSPAKLAAHAALPHGEIWGYTDANYVYVLPSVFRERIAGNMDAHEAAKVLESVGMAQAKDEKRGDNAVRRYHWQNVRPIIGGPQIITYRLKFEPDSEPDSPENSPL